ncbi:MAG TPA: hypothetical protein VM070_03700 [Candidatus Saccharimonadales bacterium]|nr:hypothetical protein [Candidatus Saccharimonadales bacterium]
MSSFLGGLWSNTFGLLVEDGSLAIGIVVSLVIAATIAGPARQPDLAGWTLLGTLVLLLVANVYRAGLAAKRAVAPGPKTRA